MEDKIVCPLVDDEIDIIDCLENRDIKEEYIPEKYKKKKNWKDICKSCKYYDY